MDDHNWNSGFCANITSEWLQTHGKEKPQIIYYPKTGHCIDPPYFPPLIASVHAQLDKATFHGGEPRAQSRAQVNAWQKILTFFQNISMVKKKSVKCSKI